MLIAPFPKNEGNLLGISGIAGIINNGDQSTFAITNPEATAWNIGSETVGADFPLENLSATSYLTATGIQTIAVMGNNVMQTIQLPSHGPHKTVCFGYL